MANSTLTPAERRKAQKARRNIAVALVLCVGGGIFWYQWAKAHQVDPTAKLITAKVTHADLIQSVAATGSVTAQTGAEVHVGSQITGTIKELKADIGTVVKANDPIAILNLPDLDAQVRQSKAAYDEAVTKLQQTRTGVDLEITQTKQNLLAAEESVRSNVARVAAAEAAVQLQTVQTPTDIRRAQSTLSAAKAALSTANSALKQTQASTNLEIATAQETVNQDQATYNNTVNVYKRNQALLVKGFVAGSVVDDAVAAEAVAQGALTSAKENVDLVKAKVEADLQSAKDTVSQAKQNVDSAQAALENTQAEPYQDKVKVANLNDAKNQLAQARSALATAQANTIQDKLKQQDVLQAEEAVRVGLATYQYNLAQQDKSIIRSPIAGTVLNLAVQQGETLAAGLASPTVIVVADLHRLQVDAYVDETDIGKIKLGQDASVIVDAFPKKTFKGKVVKVAAGSTIQQGVVTYDVTIALTQKDIDDRKRKLLPDMTVNVTLQTGKLTNVLVVPSVAIKVSTKGSTVNVLTHKDGKPVVTPTKVSTGGNDEANTEIRKGLNEGDVVILAGLDSGNKNQGPQSPFGPKQGSGGSGGGGGGRGGK